MTSGAVAHLARRGIVAVSGPDAEKFLSDLATSDISAAKADRAAYAGLLTPQGKVLFDFIVFRDGDGFLLDVLRERAGDLAKRLSFYRLRAKVTVADVSGDRSVLAGWRDAPLPAGIATVDPRLGALGWRAMSPLGASANATESDYDAHRIALGIPEGGIDFPFGDAFPHDADMDQLGGVDFTKGCYVGQEVVARMEHRHTARRRIVVVHGTALPGKGTEIVAGSTSIGTLGSSAKDNGLALIRLDRAKEALDRSETPTAAGVSLQLEIPAWARFSWPAPAGT